MCTGPLNKLKLKLKVETVNEGGLVVKRSQKLDNVVCEQPLKQRLTRWTYLAAKHPGIIPKKYQSISVASGCKKVWGASHKINLIGVSNNAKLRHAYWPIVSNQS